MPEICMACHGGIYTGQPSEQVSRAVFLPFDLDSFRYDADGDPQGVNQAAVQEQFRELNEIVLDTDPDDSTTDINKPIAQLVNKWYPGGVHFGTFSFGTGANEIHGFVGHEPLYDDVVKRVCRTCHIARGVFAAGTPASGTPDDFTKYADMNTLNSLIQAYACGSASPETHQTRNFAMPHAEVPFKFFWQKNLSSTLDSELNLGPPHCPNQ